MALDSVPSLLHILERRQLARHSKHDKQGQEERGDGKQEACVSSVCRFHWTPSQVLSQWW
jgi:hypothetical protein